VKLAGKRSAGNPHAAFDEAGVGNGVDDPLEGDTRPKGEKRFGLTRSRTATAPVLDPTCEKLRVKFPGFTRLLRRRRQMRIISIRHEPNYKEVAVKYIHSKWGNENNYQLYEDSIFGCVSTKEPMPYWYLLEDDKQIIGCIGLIDHDFISRTDLSPWLCSLYIEKDHRGKALGSLLIEQVKKDAAQEGFEKIYLCTKLNDFYEKYDFHYIGVGFYPNSEPSNTYEANLAR